MTSENRNNDQNPPHTRRISSRQEEEAPATEPLNDAELRRLVGGDVEPIDLNLARTEVKPTVWHRFIQ